MHNTSDKSADHSSHSSHGDYLLGKRNIVTIGADFALHRGGKMDDVVRGDWDDDVGLWYVIL